MDQEKAQSHSLGKKPLTNIWEWLDEDFLLAMAETMRIPVEVLGKYPKNNWKKGVGDKDFIKARLNSLQRHLVKHIQGEFEDEETGQEHITMVAVNAMMIFHSLKGENIVIKTTKKRVTYSQKIEQIFNPYFIIKKKDEVFFLKPVLSTADESELVFGKRVFDIDELIEYQGTCFVLCSDPEQDRKYLASKGRYLHGNF